MSAVTPERTPTMSASSPNRPVTWRNTWACVSIMPGRTRAPRTSIFVPAAGRPGPTAAQHEIKALRHPNLPIADPHHDPMRGARQTPKPPTRGGFDAENVLVSGPGLVELIVSPISLKFD